MLISRVTLTQDVLRADRELAAAVVDERGVARAWTQMGLLAELPDGFRIERTAAVVPFGQDPGCELVIFDERSQPERVVGKIARRRIGSQRVTWTPCQLADVLMAAAMSVALQLVVCDAERP